MRACIENEVMYPEARALLPDLQDDALEPYEEHHIMIISVLERRSEIGLRRALGATRRHIRIQFLTEAIALALLGGVAGVIVGAVAAAIYAHGKGWATVIPPEAWAGGLAAALLIGAAAGLLPAIRAARLSPTQALWSL